MNPSVQAMIFDFDGTLAHLTLDFTVMRHRAMAAARTAAGRHGRHNLPEDDGRPVLEWLHEAHGAMAAQCTATAEAVRQAAHAAIEDVEIEAAARGALFPWTRTMLGRLRSEGVAIGIITRNCRRAVLAVFPDVMDFSACLLTREDVPQVKPDPDHLHRALALTGTPRQHSLMVGDHPMDIETGKAGGTLTAGVASGNSSREVLEAAGPDFIAEDCQDLYRQLRSLRRMP